MINIFKLYGLTLAGFLYLSKADCSEFKNEYYDTFFFVNDSDRVCSIDVRELKNARLYTVHDQKEVNKPIQIRPGRYQCVSLKYLSDYLEPGHILFYGIDIVESYKNLIGTNTNKYVDGSKSLIIGSLDFIIPENKSKWHALLDNNCLAKFAVNKKLGLVLQRENRCDCIIMKLMNMLPEYRYTNRCTLAEYTCSFTGKEYPKEELEDGDTRPIYSNPVILEYYNIPKMYKQKKTKKKLIVV